MAKRVAKMDFNLEIVKKHPYAFGGLIIGAIVLYLVISHSSSSSDGSVAAPSASGGNAATNTAAQLQSQQIAAGVQTSQIQADVANNQTDAALQAQQLNTAASLQLGTEQVNAQVAQALAGDFAGVKTAQIQSDTQLGLAQINGQTQTNVAEISGETQVAQTEAESEALTNVAAIEGQTQLGIAQAQTSVQNNEIGLQGDYLDALAAQHKLGGDSTGVSQIASSVLSLGQQGPSAIAANQPSKVASDNAVGGLLKSVTSGLFGL